MLGEKDFTELQDFTETTIIPAIRGVDGVFEIDIDGNSERRILVTVNTEKMSLYRTSIFQISQSLRNNNVVIPAGAIRSANQTIPVKASNTYKSILFSAIFNSFQMLGMYFTTYKLIIIFFFE